MTVRDPDANSAALTAGTFENGTDVIERFVSRTLRVYSQEQDMRDGSGLASTNRTTARQLAELMAYMATDTEVGAYWRDSLPIGGVRGTLRARFQQTTETRTLAGRVTGKTGLIGGVRSLTGIATTAGGREVAFSVVLNRFRVPESKAIALIDKVALTIAGATMPK
jgi:D-alanyl-D-alanine carboxypeptidase/D-alanyl-D-alanine-endopeptidase (penicillin-binding protein 4)